MYKFLNTLLILEWTLYLGSKSSSYCFLHDGDRANILGSKLCNGLGDLRCLLATTRILWCLPFKDGFKGTLVTWKTVHFKLKPWDATFKVLSEIAGVVRVAHFV